MIELDIQLQKADFLLQATFAVPAKGVTGVFGPSGCGKTTLLRAVAGLEPETTGTVSIAGQKWLDWKGRGKGTGTGKGKGKGKHSTAVDKRQVGVVFQNPGLFAHLSVEQNLLYGRKRLKQPSKLIELTEFYRLLGVENLLNRSTQGLSGGEAQRVALGRALLAEPRLLLMDEPLSALDQSSRSQLMSFLENFFQQIDIPVFYISHSTEEVARLADNLVLMKAGRVCDFGSIRDVLASVDGELSSTDAAFSVFEGSVKEKGLACLTTVSCRGGIDLQLPRANTAIEPGTRVRLRIRARDVSLCMELPKGSSILNILPARITDITAQAQQGSRLVKLNVGGEQLLSKVSEYSVQQLNLQKGMFVYAQIKSAALLG